MKTKKGFTLIEMMVVIAIIAVLVSIIIPVIGNSNNRAGAAANAANLRNIYGKLNIMKLQEPEAFEDLITGNYHGGISIGDSSFIGQILEEISAKKFATFTASNGTISLPNGTVLDALPSSQVVTYMGGYNSKTVKIPKGTEMTVLITDTHILTFYEHYTTSNFADIAEDGVLDGAVYGGWDNAILEAICRRLGHHTFIGGKCIFCKYPQS